MVLVRALETLSSLGLISVATTLITQQDYAAKQIWPTGQWNVHFKDVFQLVGFLYIGLAIIQLLGSRSKSGGVNVALIITYSFNAFWLYKTFTAGRLKMCDLFKIWSGVLLLAAFANLLIILLPPSSPEETEPRAEEIDQRDKKKNS